MKVKYITIEREYGSGGTKIARRLAEETGVACYGREILEAVSRKQNISVDEIDHYEETVSNSFLYSIFVMGKAAAGESDMLSREGHIFVAEQREIQLFARRGRAIFLGHCASEALKGQEQVVRVFIRCTDEAQKKARIMEDYGIPETAVESTQKRFDKRRANYYYANTGRRWDDFKNYDMVLDSAVLGVDGCVAALKGLLTV
ncbi:MAG: AAA family ATPase [Oscillospiraceae bacterium]